MLKIVMTNGAVIKWLNGEFTSHSFEPKALKIMNEGECVGWYNLDFVISIIKKSDGEAAASDLNH